MIVIIKGFIDSKLGNIVFFLILFFLIGFLPIFIQFGFIEARLTDGGSVYQWTYDNSNFYDSLKHHDARDPPTSLKFITNLSLNIIYTLIVYLSVKWMIRKYKPILNKK